MKHNSNKNTKLAINSDNTTTSVLLYLTYIHTESETLSDLTNKKIIVT